MSISISTTVVRLSYLPIMYVTAYWIDNFLGFDGPTPKCSH
jgi:hypothetical protein